MRPSSRLAIAAACVAGLAVCAPPAMADTNFFADMGNGDDGSGFAFVFQNNASGSSFTGNLIRNGSVIASDTENFPEVSLEVPNKGPLVAGDQIQFLVDGAVALTLPYDGTPTINADACLGSKTFTGAVGDAGTFSAEVFHPSGVGSGFSSKKVTVNRANGAYTATVDSALESGDFVDAFQDKTVDNADVTQFAGAKPGACPTPAPPAPPVTPPATPPGPKPVTPPAAPTGTQIFAALQAALAQSATLFNALDLPSFVRTGREDVPFTFLVPGQLKLVMVYRPSAHQRSASIARKAKKAKAVTVAGGTASRSTPGVAKVRVRLSKAGKKLLRHSSSIKLTLQATFTPAGGGKPQTTTTKVSLKKHAKRTKKHAKRG